MARGGAIALSVTPQAALANSLKPAQAARKRASVEPRRTLADTLPERGETDA